MVASGACVSPRTSQPRPSMTALQLVPGDYWKVALPPPPPDISFADRLRLMAVAGDGDVCARAVWNCTPPAHSAAAAPHHEPLRIACRRVEPPGGAAARR
eukprot:5188102-Prymnesium_polylepis.1